MHRIYKDEGKDISLDQIKELNAEDEKEENNKYLMFNKN